MDKILEKINKDDSGVDRTPLDNSLHLSKNREKGISQVEYSRVIRSLMYLMSCTRPDIAYTINRLSRYTSNPSADHWKTIVRVLRYLRYTHNFGLHYTRYLAVLEGCHAPTRKGSTRGNRRVPLSEFQFPKNPSKDSQGTRYPSSFEKRFTDPSH